MCVFDENFHLKLETKKESKSTKVPDVITCPKCKKGTVLKGKSAYGCSEHSKGCNYVVPFSTIKELAKGKDLTKELVYKILLSQ